MKAIVENLIVGLARSRSGALLRADARLRRSRAETTRGVPERRAVGCPSGGRSIMSEQTKRKRDLSNPEGLAEACAHSDRAATKLRELGIGGRVMPSLEARKAGVASRHNGGVIAGWGRHKWTVLVRPDGNKTSVSYHVDFWEPLR